MLYCPEWKRYLGGVIGKSVSLTLFRYDAMVFVSVFEEATLHKILNQVLSPLP